MNRTINTQLLWTAPKVIESVSSDSFSFNDWSLNDWISIRIKESNHDDIWNIDFSTYKTPLQDWWGVLWKYYRTKTIKLLLSLSALTEEALNDLVDEIKYRTDETEWRLRISINGKVRERNATRTALKFNRKGWNITFLWDVELTFTCINPHAHSNTQTMTSIMSQTWSYQSAVQYDWRTWAYPSLYLTMDSWTSAWMRYELNWYVIEINTTLTEWDIIIFNWETKQVLVNWSEVAYSWPFVPLEYWENIYSITNSWTFTWTLSYYLQYL